MICQYKTCGGCYYKNVDFEEYQNQKTKKYGNIIFAPLASRRRANFSFTKKSFGFFEAKTHNIVDIEQCNNLSFEIKHIKKFVLNLGYANGEVFVTKADNGLAIKIICKEKITLDNKLDLADFINENNDVISVCINDYEVKKSDPYIEICGYKVFIYADSFLQPTKQTEAKMIEMTSEYLLDTNGNILDLFCGLGTFSYPLSVNVKNKITSVDSSQQALELFERTVNYNKIQNIEIKKQNLMKYPLTAKELEVYDAILFDPPYAGALSQVTEICKCSKKFKKIVAVSCNEQTFLRDKEELLKRGYALKQVTYVDQFLYSEDHIELVALFE